jgi:hypothetical protein
MGQKTVKTICFTACLVICLLVLLPVTFAYWPDNDGQFSHLITISRWHEDDAVVANFDDAVHELKRRDPFLANYRRIIHILGDADVQESPIVPLNFEIYDVLLFKSSGSIIAVQIVGDISNSIFSSWESLIFAIERPGAALNRGGGEYRSSDTYTRSHATVRHAGSGWLARHDNVTGTPQVGADWFLSNDSWLAQHYPVGSLVEHGGRHFLKVAEADGMPGENAAIWHELPFVDRYYFDPPEWYARAWNFHDVVSFGGNFYASLISNNTTSPAGGQWQRIVPFDVMDTVPEFDPARQPPNAYPTGALVRRTIGEETEFFVHTGNVHWTTPLGGTAWERVSNWDELTGVLQWQPWTMYDTTNFAGKIVEHEGKFFERRGAGATVGVPPRYEPLGWRRVLTWQEAQAPVEFVPSDWAGNRIFQVTTGDETEFFALIQPTWATNPERPWDVGSVRFRRISEWNPAINYHVVGNIPWGTTGFAHAYTRDPATGEIVFWEVAASPTGSSGTVNGGMAGGNPNDFLGREDASPFWRRHRFEVRENIIISHVGGTPVVWERNTASLQPLPPSILNNDWQRRDIAITNTFVYTEHQGAVTLWRNISGSTTLAPGNPEAWQQIHFQTNKNFVFISNEYGVPHFFFSAIASSAFPALGSGDWLPLNINNYIVPDYFYMNDENGRPMYFTVAADGNWNELLPAWTGHSQNIRYHWCKFNTYYPGDIVCYGITGTHTYRYFRLMGGENAAFAAGVPPHSPTGNLFWEEVR